jgi:predicted transposase YbfD/YdcC
MKTTEAITGISLFKRHFGAIADPRVARTRRHPLLNLLFLAYVGILCGAEGWDAIVVIAEGKRDWLKSFFDLRHGIPSADTFRRVFSRLDTEALEKAFRAWTQAFAKALTGQVVALDGKSIKSAFDEASRTTPLHLLHVWATAQQLLLAQKAVNGAPGEPGGAKELLNLLALEGAIVTADANLCTKDVMQAVLDRKAQYILALKGNRGPLYESARGFFEAATETALTTAKAKRCRRVQEEHGRLEIRESIAVPASVLGEQATSRPGLASLLCVKRERTEGSRTVSGVHYYVSSLPPKVQALHEHVQEHWAIENGLHWTLDVVFKEDESRVQDKRAAHNLAILRRMALVQLRKEKTNKNGAPLRRLKAATDSNYLVKVLASGLEQN